MRVPLILLTLSLTVHSRAAGFSEPSAVFYGKVMNQAAGQTQQLYEGELKIQLGDLILTTEMSPTGAGEEYSYSVDVPLRYLPAPGGSALSVSSVAEFYDFGDITIDAVKASPLTTADGYAASFASRGEQVRLDLAVSIAATDSDGDGMPDWWEEQHGLNPNWAGDATLDTDNDTKSNLAEFLAGSDPQVANTEPSLLARTIRVPESGRAGFLISVIDFDSAATDIELKLTGLTNGFTLLNSGGAVSLDDVFTLADVASGNLVLRHSNPLVTYGTLELELSDGSSGPIPASLPIAVFNPGEKSTLWLDATSLASLADDARFDRWPDRSPKAGEAWQSAADAFPRYTASRRGKPAVSFDGNNRHLLLEDDAIPDGAMSLFAFYEVPDRDEPQALLATNRAALHFDQEEHQQAAHSNGATNGKQSLSARTVLSSVQFDEDGFGAAFIDGRYDGSAGDGNGLPPVQAALGLRREASGATSDPFGGYLHELVIIDGAVDTLQRRRITDYLSSKWRDAVVWDWADETTPITARGGNDDDILRGGQGDDDLNGGAGNDLISSGPGNDTMLGGPGNDTFVFSHADDGRDTIGDFDPDADVLELSELFSNHDGAPRAALRVRVESTREGDTPLTHTILSAFDQEIVLVGLALSEKDLDDWIENGTVRMGAPKSTKPAIAFDIVDRFASRIGQAPATIRLTRDGPVHEALTVDLIVEGDALVGVDYEGFPAVATFAPGSDSAVITIKPSDTLRGLSAAQSVTVKLATAPDRYTTRALNGATIHIIDTKIREQLTYPKWRLKTMPTGPNREPHEDKDNDGIVNVIEYAIGTDPCDNTSPLGMVVPQEEYVLDERFHIRFKTTAAIIDANYQLFSFKEGGPALVADDEFEVLQRLLPSGMIERVYRSRTPASNASGVGLYLLGITLDDHASKLAE